eukprot:UN06855
MAAEPIKELDEKKDINEKMDVKILFLDVDGVLCDLALFENNESGLERDKTSGLYITHLQRLKTIIDKTNCYIVLSSAWRLFESSKKMLFHAMGMDRIGIDVKKRYLGDTPKNLKNRVTEIKSWLSQHEQYYNLIGWVAVDDMPLDEIEDGGIFMKAHFVNTNSSKGMSDADMNKIISIFNTK